MALKLNIGDPKTGKTHKKELNDDESKGLIGKKIGDKFSGNSIGLSGYEFQITGGSDSAGFPMRWDAEGPRRRRILTKRDVGFRKKFTGLRQRVTVAGNTISANTVQLNVKIIKHGKQALDATPEAPAEGESSEEKKEEKTEDKKEEPKAAEKEESKEKEDSEEKSGDKKEEKKDEKESKKEEKSKDKSDNKKEDDSKDDKKEEKPKEDSSDKKSDKDSKKDSDEKKE